MTKFSVKTLFAIVTAIAATFAVATYAADSDKLWIIAAIVGGFLIGNLALCFVRTGDNRAFHLGCFLFAFGTFFSPPYSSYIRFQSKISPIYLDLPTQIYL